MPRICTICSHKQRKQINAALGDSLSFSAIACNFNLNRETVRRHAQICVPDLIQTAESKQVSEAVEVADAQAKYCQQTYSSTLDKTRFGLDIVIAQLEAGGFKTVHDLAALTRELRGFIDLEAKLRGDYTKDKDNPDTLNHKQRVAEKQIERIMREMGIAEPEARRYFLEAVPEASEWLQ